MTITSKFYTTLNIQYVVGVECNPSQFRCTSGDCIDVRRRCDGRVDCRDQSDEQACRKYTVYCDIVIHLQCVLYYCGEGSHYLHHTRTQLLDWLKKKIQTKCYSRLPPNGPILMSFI